MGYKVGIINPGTRKVIEANEPLNIMGLATYLKQNGINVRIIDEVSGDDVVRELVSFSPDIVGFTATTCTYPRACQLLKMIKPMKFLTVIGGVHASTLPEKALEDGFDMVAVGEGEKMFLEIIARGEKKGVFRTTREMVLMNEDICRPDRTLVNMDFYSKTKDRSPHDFNLDFVPFGAKMACMLTSRGCPFNCIFCHNGWRGTPIRLLKPESIVEEIELLIRDYGIRYIWFLDDDFFQVKNRVLDFCELISKRNLKFFWATSARADSVNDEVLHAAARIGCKRIAFGFESGSQRILDILNKKSNIERNFIAAQMCNKHRIEVGGLFMVGNPTETEKDISMTWEFIKKAKLDTISISVVTPFPGTQLWKWCEERGYIPPNIDFSSFYYSYASIQVPDTFTPLEIENIKRRLLTKIYMLHPKIRRRFMIKMIRHPFLMLEKVIDYIPFMSSKKAS